MNINGPDKVMRAGLQNGNTVWIRLRLPHTRQERATYLALYGQGVILNIGGKVCRVPWNTISRLWPDGE